MRKNLSRNRFKIDCFLLFVLFLFGEIGLADNTNIRFIENSDISVVWENACDNATDGGLIESDETGCPDPIFDPAPIVNVVFPGGGSGDLEYLWMFTTQDPNGASSNWTPIPNSNFPDYDPGPITVTTHYVRCARRSECVDYAVESNVVTKRIQCCENVTSGGTIGEDQSICGDSINPDIIQNIISPSGGMGILEYQWFQNTTGVPFDINNPDWMLISGAESDSYDPDMLYETTYFIRCSKRDSCRDFEGKSNIIEIAVNQVPVLDSVHFENLTCFESSDGSITVFASGGTVPYSYIWTGGVPNSANPTGLSAGDYTVFVSDDAGCESKDTLKITLTQPDEIILETNWWKQGCDQLTGGNAAVRVISGGTAPFTYLWNDTGATTTDSLQGVPAGIYRVTVTDSVGCTVVDTVEITISQSNQIVLETDWWKESCDLLTGGSAAVQVISGAVAPFTYLWSDSGATTSDSLHGVTSGTYQVTVTDSVGCMAVDTVEIVLDNLLAVSFTMVDPSCYGFADGQISAVHSGSGQYTYLWDDPLSTRDSILDNVPAGVYHLTITDSDGCEVIDSTMLSEPDSISVNITAVDGGCDTPLGSATANVTGGVGNYFYEWNPTFVNTQTATDLPSGAIFVLVTDDAGCTGVARDSINNTPVLETVTAKEDFDCMLGINGSVWVTPSGGQAPYTFLWSDTNNSQTDTVKNLISGTYYVTVTDDTGCEKTDSVRVDNVSPLILSVFKTDNKCPGDEEGMAWATVSGGQMPYVFNWDDPSGSSNDTIFNLPAGIYNLTVTDANNCMEFAQVEILELSDLTGSVRKTDLRCFELSEGVAEVLPTGGAGNLTYLWSDNHNRAVNRDLAAGTYYVTVTDDDNCQYIDSVTLTQPTEIICSSSVVQPISGYNENDGVVEVTASGGIAPLTYMWSNGETTAQINDLEPDTYYSAVIDQNGCECISSIELINPSRLGGYVWDDDNEDGLQNMSESGLENISVTLTGTDNNSQAVNLTTATDINGNYEFDGLTGGDYQINFGIPTDYFFSPQDIGTDDNIDSDADAATGDVINIFLNQGSQRHYDAGMYREDINLTVEIGDYVWIDTDRDGNQDRIESGIPDFRVHLVDAGTNTAVKNTLTNLNGEYIFADVAPGDYYILFDPISLPSGFVFSSSDQVADDQDSDANNVGKTDVFTVSLGQADDLTWDAGIYETCDDVTNGGIIGDDEQLCGTGADPAEIRNINSPTGGVGALEYLWLQSFTPIYNGPGDPNWVMIPNSNSASYDPPAIAATSYYIRCVRRVGCPEFLSESNIVKKEILPVPEAEILNPPSGACVGDLVDFSAKAIGGVVDYSWSFGGGGNPATADTRVVNNVIWSTSGQKQVELTVVRMGCTDRDTAVLAIANCNPLPGDPDFMFYPNPATNLLKIKALKNISEKTEIHLLNVFGEILSKISVEKGATGTKLDLGKLPTGIYFIKSGSGTENEEMTKIIIQK